MACDTLPEAEPGVQMNMQLAAMLLATDLFIIRSCFAAAAGSAGGEWYFFF